MQIEHYKLLMDYSELADKLVRVFQDNFTKTEMDKIEELFDDSEMRDSILHEVQ